MHFRGCIGRSNSQLRAERIEYTNGTVTNETARIHATIKPKIGPSSGKSQIVINAKKPTLVAPITIGATAPTGTSCPCEIHVPIIVVRKIAGNALTSPPITGNPLLAIINAMPIAIVDARPRINN